MGIWLVWDEERRGTVTGQTSPRSSRFLLIFLYTSRGKFSLRQQTVQRTGRADDARCPHRRRHWDLCDVWGGNNRASQPSRRGGDPTQAHRGPPCLVFALSTDLDESEQDSAPSSKSLTVRYSQTNLHSHPPAGLARPLWLPVGGVDVLVGRLLWYSGT